MNLLLLKLCALLLQPHPKTTNREIVTCLKLRLSLWTQGDVTTLMDEGCVIQHRLLSQSCPSQKLDGDNRIGRCFTDCILHGNVRGALNLLTAHDQPGLPTSQLEQTNLS